MTPKRLLCVGDIHGYADKLTALLNRVRVTKQDQMVFLGDYIDRGPNSKAVINFLIDFSLRFPQTIFLRGNHEQQLLNFIHSGATEDLEFFLKYGGEASLESYGGFAKIPAEHLAFIRATKLWHLQKVEGQEYLFVHAGVNPNRTLTEQTPYDLMRIRDPFLKSPKPLGETIVVHGHTPSPDVPGKEPYRIEVDSGVYLDGPLAENSQVFGGKLSCCNVLTREIWQA